MAGAAFTVELDTTAPVLSISPGTWNPATRVLSIPAASDEPATLIASYAPFNSPVSYPLWWVAGVLTATLPPDVDGGNGRAQVTATDDVLNSSSYVITLGREPVFVPTVRHETLDLTGWFGDGPTLRVIGVSPGDNPAPRVDPTKFPRRR